MATRNILAPIDFSGETVSVVSAYGRLVMVNETPLVARLPRRRGRSVTFTVLTRGIRPRAYVLGAALADGTGTTLTLTSANGGVSPLMVGDVLELASGERVEVTGNISTTANTLTMRRAREGTTGAAQSNGTSATLIGNSRTGTEVDQEAYRIARTGVTQNHQRFQFPIQVGRRALAIDNVVTPGAGSILDDEREAKFIDMYSDMEYSSYYGKGEAESAAGDRSKQKGLRSLVGTVKTAADITDEAAYTPDSMLRDLFQPIFDNGGNADLVLCSTGFMGGLFKWGFAKAQTTNLGQTELGANVEGFAIPFYGRTVKFIPSPKLGSATNHTAVALSSDEVAWSFLEEEQYLPRGSRGDAVEGEWYADGCVYLESPMHHAWIEGITTFAAP